MKIADVGLALLLVGHASGALAQGAAGAVVAGAASSAAQAQGHRHGTAAAHRVERTKGLQERAAGDPKQLRASCRYESEIATPPPRGKVALTFDDGPEPGQTELIIEVLLRQQVPATFFLVASKALAHPALVHMVLAQPSLRVASHSWSHPNFHELSLPQQLHEIDLAEATLSSLVAAAPAPVAASVAAAASPNPASAAAAAVGHAPTASNGAAAASSGAVSVSALKPRARPVPSTKFFRYPYGNSSCGADAHLHLHGYRVVGWHIDSCDWAFDGDGKVNDREASLCGVARPFRADFVGHVAAAVRARQGGIVLLHDIHPDTAKNLEALIVQLKKEGFSFVDLSDPGFASALR